MGFTVWQQHHQAYQSNVWFDTCIIKCFGATLNSPEMKVGQNSIEKSGVEFQQKILLEEETFSTHTIGIYLCPHLCPFPSICPSISAYVLGITPVFLRAAQVALYVTMCHFRVVTGLMYGAGMELVLTQQTNHTYMHTHIHTHTHT